jgi:copper chaperone CopZ
MEELRYSVPDVSCSHCERAIAAEVGAVPGVAGVVVDLDAKVVAVRGENLDDGAVRAAIAEAGYTAA